MAEYKNTEIHFKIYFKPFIESQTSEKPVRIQYFNHSSNRRPACNSTYPKGGVSCSKDSFVVNQSLVFQIKFCGKSPALRVAANR